MSEKPQSCTVSIALKEGLWFVLLEYEDGSIYLSRDTFSTEREAEQAAFRWANENNIPERLHS